MRRRTGAAGACFAHHRLPLIRCAASAKRRLVSTRVDARVRRGRASHSSASLVLVARRVMRERRRLVSTHVDARARRGRASHSPASPVLAAPRQRDGGRFCLRKRKGAAGAGVLRTALPPPFCLRRVSETAAGFYMRRLTHGRCRGGGVLRTAPPPPFFSCAASERRRLVSTCA